MGHGGAGNGINYDVLPKPRSESTVMYAEGGDSDEALAFLGELSDQSDLYVTDYKLGMQIHPGENPITGREVSENLETGEDEGYVLALYDVADDAASIENPEIYVAFSDQLPRGNMQRFAGNNPEILNGTTVEGVDTNLDTRDLWEEARKSGVEDIRVSKKAHKAFRSFVGHTSL